VERKTATYVLPTLYCTDRRVNESHFQWENLANTVDVTVFSDPYVLM
jgi:hypothetical protein